MGSICNLKNGTVIGDYRNPYIIAEVNTSHGGSVETAKNMIDEVKRVGCNCVKFQSWTAETLYSKTYYDANPISKRIVSKMALSEEDLLELSQYCISQGIDFASTPYSSKEVDFLAGPGKAPFIKVASMDINNIPFLQHIAATGMPIVLSTGMADMKEIANAIRAIEDMGNHSICLLHCISIYPAEVDTINLNNMLGLREAFPSYPVGFSDHSLGVEMATGAVALGACVIEKHFTLDKGKIGMDNGMAIEPNEMALLVSSCRNVHKALGSKERTVLPIEQQQRLKMRRSIVAARDLRAGTVLSAGDLGAKRPGTGIEPAMMNCLIGKTVKRDIAADTLVSTNDIEDLA